MGVVNSNDEAEFDAEFVRREILDTSLELCSAISSYQNWIGSYLAVGDMTEHEHCIAAVCRLLNTTRQTASLLCQLAEENRIPEALAQPVDRLQQTVSELWNEFRLEDAFLKVLEKSGLTLEGSEKLPRSMLLNCFLRFEINESSENYTTLPLFIPVPLLGVQEVSAPHERVPERVFVFDDTPGFTSVELKTELRAKRVLRDLLSIDLLHHKSHSTKESVGSVESDTMIQALRAMLGNSRPMLLQDEPFQVLDTELNEVRWFDPTGCKSWGPVQQLVEWDQFEDAPLIEDTEFLYQQPTGHWTFLSYRTDSRLGVPELPSAQRWNDQKAAEWLLSNRFEVPEAIAPLADAMRFHSSFAVTKEAAIVPVWDAERYELRFRGEVIRKVRPIAEQVLTLLNVFHEDEWQRRVDTPFADGQKTREAIKSANKGLKVIRFKADGHSEGIEWELLKEAAPSDEKADEMPS